MKKLFFWLGLILIFILVLGCCFHIFHWCDNGTRTTACQLWFTAFGSFGSFGAVVVALYLEPIKKFFLKPDLRMIIGNNAPLCIISNTEVAASRNEEFIDICCKVINNGDVAADKCRVVCEEILTLGADKKYAVSEENKFRPQFFTWIGAGEKRIETDIGESFYEYLKLAEIRTRSSELGKASNNGLSKTAKIPYVVVCLPSRKVKGQHMQFDDESSIIIHLSIVGVGFKTVEKYIQIIWEGKTISEFHSHPEKLAIVDVTHNIKTLLR